MDNDSNIYILDDIKKELKELYAKQKIQEERLNFLEQSESHEQVGYNDWNDDYEPPISDIEAAANELYDTNLFITRNEDILQKIEQCEEFKKKYVSGYKRIIRNQTHKSVEDKLNRKEKAREIAKVVNSKQVKTVGIFGAWGTGKSTFLEYLKEEFTKDKTKIIDIKATEYSDQEKLWAYFFSKMKEDVKKDYKLRVCYFFLRVKKNIKKLFIPLSYLGLEIALISILFRYDFFNDFSLMMGIDENAAKLINVGMNWFISILFVIKWILPLVGQIMEVINVTINNFSFLPKREVDEKLGYKVVVKEYIEEIINIWKNYRFIFCVDELDRCSNTAIMSFLEAIQLLEDYDSVQIIYTIDTEIVLNAIKESGIHNPHNYLKKYVDLKVDLISINSQSDYIETIAKDDYEFSIKEIEKIKMALENLEINISMRDYIHILNSLSELKERWITEEVLSEKCKRKDVIEDTLNWYNSIPIAIFFFAGSFWPSKIYSDFRIFKRAYIKVYHIAQNGKIEQQYKDCPDFIKQTNLIDVLNVWRYLQEMPPVYRECVNEMQTNME